ncbi:unnamed protein product [Danaus chrysippus]|uniref:(African queen) hypothetical protein n=1 Tax=Danaus chrysippus TaxID=151541 RepID=A0A8J2R1Q1_9NEOP|nr:unnamed protein product [Danaus chrysippus]
MDGYLNSSLEEKTIYDIYRACRLCGAGAGYKMPIMQNVVHLDSSEKQLQSTQDRLNQPHLKVFQDCVTRWNSTFYMFERFSKIKDALTLYMNDNEIDPIRRVKTKVKMSQKIVALNLY